MRKLDVKDGRLLLHTEWQERQLAASLPGARWSRAERCWSVPAMPAVWRMVCERWPDDAAVRAALENNAAVQHLQRVLEVRREVRRGLPSKVDYPTHTTPWRHQVRMTQFLRRMDAALLDAWMGTGKTKAVLDALRAVDARLALVVCPLSVAPVWKSEVRKHAPGAFEVRDLTRGKLPERAERLRIMLGASTRAAQLVLINYDVYWRRGLGELIAAVEWDAVVLDESHRIKSPGAKCSRFAARLKARCRWCLTGTPMPHSPLDLYGQYRFLDPGVFGSRFAAFRARYAVMGGYEGKQVVGFRNLDELRERMDELCLHVRAGVLDLPSMQVLDRFCELEPRAARVYRQLEQHFVAELESGVVTAANALSKLLRLQQVAAGWVPDESGELVEVSRAKRELLRDMLTDLTGERVVVFCRFRRDLQTVHELARELGLRSAELSGDRKEYGEWKRGTPDVLACQIQAGSLGIDLTEARVGLFYTLGYSLGDYQQACARLHRPGQDRPVVFYRLLARGTVDEAIVRALDRRREVVQSVLKSLSGKEVQGVAGRGR